MDVWFMIIFCSLQGVYTVYTGGLPVLTNLGSTNPNMVVLMSYRPPVWASSLDARAPCLDRCRSDCAVTRSCSWLVDGRVLRLAAFPRSKDHEGSGWTLKSADMSGLHSIYSWMEEEVGHRSLSIICVVISPELS